MRAIIAMLCALMAPTVARGYMVAPAAPLEELVKAADVILKGTVVSSAKVKDDSFRALPPFAVFATRLKMISVIKGEVTGQEIEFRHYDEDPESKVGHMYAPQHYHFDEGKSYIVFAKKTPAPGVYRPLWDSHRGKEDQGQVRAADDKPLAAGTDARRAIWDELIMLAASAEPADVRYAIAQLHSMSGSADRFNGTRDFAREKVLRVVGPLIGHEDEQVEAAAIAAAGGRSPYGDTPNMGWMATVGKGSLLRRGHATYEEGWSNPDARALLPRLLEVADHAAKPAALRARAIEALGLVKEEVLRGPLRRWSMDRAPEVRAAAAVLWTDFGDAEAARTLVRLAEDADVSVRRSVAAAIGYLQQPELIGLLEKFLRAEDERLRAAAAMSLVAFDPKDARALLREFSNHPDFRATFINALALEDAEPWLDELAKIVKTNDEPKLHFVAQMPVYTSWQILKSELEKRPVDELRGRRFDKHLEALEQPPNIGSGPYVEVYQFYLKRGMSEHAARFRAEVKKRITTYDIDYFFERVEAR